MTTLFRSVRVIKINGYKSIIRVETDGEKLYCQVDRAPNEISIAYLSYSVEYEGVTKSVYSYPGSGTRVSFTYGDSMEIVLKNTSISVGSDTETDSYRFTWIRTPVELSLPEPDATYSLSGLQVGTSTVVTIIPSDSLSRKTKVIGMEYEHSLSSGSFAIATAAIQEASVGFTFTHSVNSIMFSNGSLIKYKIEVACYESEEDAAENSGEKFIGHTTIYSPYFILSNTGNDTPFSITYSPDDSGNPFTVSWSSHTSQGTFNVQRCLDGGDWTDVYSGTEHSFSDTIPENWKTVAYRVQCVDSPWWTGEELKSVISNMYIGTSSGIKQVSAVYIGKNGGMREIAPFMSVGGM